MAQQHINQGTPPAGTDGDTNAVAWAKAEANFTELYRSAAAIDILSKDYISGLKMVWVSGTALTVKTGSAARPSDGTLISAAADIAKTGLTLSASTWYHVYLFDNAGTADVEIVTTAPASPYFGTARAKTGDTSRRYVGSVLTDVSGNIYNFLSLPGGFISYRVKTSNAPFRVLANGKAIAQTNISLQGVIPVTSRCAYIVPTNQDATYAVYFSSSDSSEPSNEITFQASGASGMSRPPTFMHLDTSQTFSYSYQSAPTGGLYVDVWGYTYER
ncbi:hypothetical protein MBSD_n2151 [Mizugakiibacter sediminis]|uniref:Uncharacterized protein n=1 Tax=Mizugakiibacter sediminis TaxID=1475481 RepID=A0A0K8QQ59_9GAMM|nr:hypothetical protein [Mizugakiibacter sediminis]GAP66836.1 hypothetical protein MBSD_n2151 [Mizugakiibacter sediminis]